MRGSTHPRWALEGNSHLQFHGLRATVMESRLNTESKVCPMPGVASLGAPGMFPSHAHPIRPGMGEDLGIVSVVCTKDRNGKAMVGRYGRRQAW